MTENVKMDFPSVKITVLLYLAMFVILAVIYYLNLPPLPAGLEQSRGFFVQAGYSIGGAGGGVIIALLGSAAISVIAMLTKWGQQNKMLVFGRVSLFIVPIVLALNLAGMNVAQTNSDNNSANVLPNCKANPKCLLKLEGKWYSITSAEIKAIIASGADVNATTYNGVTPLHYAAATGNTEVIPALLKAGADAQKMADGGITPIGLARHRKNWEVVKLLESIDCYDLLIWQFCL